MTFLPLKDLLPKAVRSAGISDQVQAAVVVEIVRAVLPAVVPAAVVSKAQPLHFHDGQLTLQVSSSAVAQELKGHEADIVRLVNAHSPVPVERLRFEFP